MRGWGYNEVVCDEIQEFNDAPLFWATMRPLISDRGGTLLVAGQFRGTDWRYKIFCEKGGNRWDGKRWHKEAPKPGYRSFVYPAALGPCYQSERGKQDLVDASEQVPRVVFQQEYECIPTANQANPFDPDDLLAIMRGTVPHGPVPGRAYVLAADLGMYQDPTKWVVLQSPDMLVVAAGAEPLRQKHQQTALRLAQLRKEWRCACVVIDATAGAGGGHRRADEFLQFYRAAIPDVRDYHWTRDSKAQLYKSLSLHIEQHKLSIPECFADLHRELQTLEYEYKGGSYDIHAQDGYHDDYPAALGMAVQMVARGVAGGVDINLAPG